MSRYSSLVLVVVASMSATLPAQPIEGGRANEASLRVGSGGYNVYRQGVTQYGNDIMTGNITRGRQFRGYSPISSTTDFGGRTGASGVGTLDDFRRDSIGVDDVRSGVPSYLPRSYYSPTRTVQSAGDAAVGFRASGLPPGPQQYINVPTDPRKPFSSLQSGSGGDVRLFPRTDTPGIPPSGQTWSGSVWDRSALTNRSSLFRIAPDLSKPDVSPRADPNMPGTMKLTQKTSELQTMQGMYSRQEPTDRYAEQRPYERGSFQSTPLDRLINPSTPGQVGTGGLQEIPDDRPKLYPFQAATRPSPGQLESAREPGRQLSPRDEELLLRTPGGPPLPTDQGDVYRRMLKAASVTELQTTPVDAKTKGEGTQDAAGRTAPSVMKPAATPDAPSPAAEPSAPRSTLILGQQEQQRKMLQEPIVTFAGTDKTFANKAFTKAEDHLKSGRYYDAVDSYDVARSADPENPLIWIGRGHALIGAGDYLSAVASLEEGIGRFPQITRFNIDLRAFLSHKDILDIRRADLEKRLDTKEDFRLRFLLGYIEYYSGLPQYGIENIKKAAKDAPTTSPISKFPGLLGK